MKQDKMEIKTININDVKKAEYNPRKISLSELNKLKKSLEEFGCVRPLIINKRTGILVSGHQTLTAAKELKIKELPYIEVDVDEKKEKILNIALNKLSGDWDDTKLSNLLEEIKDEGSFDLTGFDVSDVDLMEKLSDDGSIISEEPAEEIKPEKYNIVFELDNENDFILIKKYFSNKKYGWNDSKKLNSNLLKNLIEDK